MGAATFDDLISRGWGQQVLQKVRDHVQMLDDSKSTSHQFHALCELVGSQLGEASDPFTRISEVGATVHKQRESLRSKAAKNRGLRAKLRDLRDSRAREVDGLTAENHSLKNTVEQLHSSATDARDTVKRLKHELSAANCAKEEAETALSQLESALRTDQSRVIDNMSKENDQAQGQLRNYVAQLRTELEKAAQTISEQDRSIQRLKKLTDSHGNVSLDAGSHFERLHGATENAHLDPNETRADRAQLIETYESTIADLRRQLDDYHANLVQVRNDLSDYAALASKLRKSVATAKSKRERAERELRERSEQFEQEAQANHVIVKAASVNAESSITGRIQELKSRLEAETQRIFALAADEFRTFVSCGLITDEQAYRALLAKVRAELQRFNESDAVIRRLIGASSRQATDDAVAQFMGS
jgi:chromosome segregation ATPase